MSRLRVVVAMDSFKGSLASDSAGEAVRLGVLDAAPDAEVLVLPLADGGEGTVEALTRGAGGRAVGTDAVDALGRPLRAAYVALPDGTAVVEAARTIGLERLTVVDDSVPPRASSTGLGLQLRQALAAGSGPVLVGLGGSATTDGGTGMLRALGADVRGGEEGNPLWSFASLDAATLPDMARVVVLSDVTNPLTGEVGAARVFGPQKGATAEQVEHLEAQMLRWAAALDAARPVSALPGAGAAGGLGAALLACGARLVGGFEEVARRSGLAEAVVGADLVVTGEGSLDHQTAMGKGPAGVARLGHDAGALVVGLAGRVDRPAPAPFDAVFAIHGEPRSLAAALDPATAAAELRATAHEVVALLGHRAPRGAR
ncbi:glycerate kinase [Nocardioides lijunqiniae]|uniref:glycerate kinase n=1 Tax=Nocardioides lijunqiniae TaxID=2760832 RepID=UPI001878EE0F